MTREKELHIVSRRAFPGLDRATIRRLSPQSLAWMTSLRHLSLCVVHGNQHQVGEGREVADIELGVGVEMHFYNGLALREKPPRIGLQPEQSPAAEKGY